MKVINETRYMLFQSFYKKKGTIQDLSLLPPCRQSLRLHCKRANYVATIWRSCFNANITFQCASQHGWSQDGKIVWQETAFPSDVESILAEENELTAFEFAYEVLDDSDSSDSEDE